MHLNKAVKLTDSVFWVGAIDWNMREFHGYETGRGSTYNAFLVLGEKITLIDTVKKPFVNEMMDRIASVINPTDIDYVVSLHSEMDHSGAIPQVLAAVRPERLFASAIGMQTLQMHFGGHESVRVLKDGEVLDLGGERLHSLMTPMLHWPDSMMAWLEKARTLVSQDGFGMHLASGERFADELPHDIVAYEAAKYYGNIVLPFSDRVQKLGETLAKKAWPIDIIAPDHGPIFRNIDSGKGPDAWILESYQRWARQERSKKAVILYDTMWNSTDQMAHAIAEGVQQSGATARLMRLNVNHESHVATEILEAGAVFVGSPTLNNELYPSIAKTLTYLRGLKRKNLIGAAFGSYGWSGEAVGRVDDFLDTMLVQRVADSIKVRYVPTKADLAKCSEMGHKIGSMLVQPSTIPAWQPKTPVAKTASAQPTINQIAPPAPVVTAPVKEAVKPEVDLLALFTMNYGLYVISSRKGDRLNGQVANAVMQITDTPNQLAVSINKVEFTHDCITASKAFTVAVLSEAATMEHIGHFGFKTGRDIDKYQNVAHEKASTGSPYPVPFTVAMIDCKLVGQYDAGTHSVFIGEIVQSRIVDRNAAPMTYAYYRQVLRGKSPPTAPSHALSELADKLRKTQSSEGAASTKMVCNVCGWVYENAKGDPEHSVPAGTPFTSLPADWKCPVCGVGAEKFSPA